MIESKKLKYIGILNLGSSIIGGLNVCFFLILFSIMFEEQIEDAIPLFCCSCTLPVLNIFRLKKQYIINSWYLIFYIIFSIYVIVHSAISIFNYYTIFQNSPSYVSHNFLWKPMIIILAFFLFFLIVGHILPKINVTGKKHDTLFLIGIIFSNLYMIWAYSILNLRYFFLRILVIIVILSILVSNDYRASKLSTRYLLLALLSFFSLNFLGIVISICNIKQIREIGFRE